MNKRKFPVTNIGSVSLLMIFIVLCMVTLAALSLSTASGSYRSADRGLARNQEEIHGRSDDPHCYRHDGNFF